ncbi:hsp70 nucleotide exchange factor fes1 [Gonapodya sp. JEL0774]|nr:hsp70 nucleotide exchange factor fes1 [Gonapodya sp. JEL0774]
MSRGRGPSRPLTASELLQFTTALSAATEKEDARRQDIQAPIGSTQPVPSIKDPKWIDVVLGKDDAVRMRECGEILSDESSSIDEKAAALDDLEMLVESSDNANNMKVLRLYPTVLALISHSSPKLRSLALWVLGTVVQNNAEGQRQFLDAGALSKVVDALSDSDQEVRARAVYAVSGALKHNPTAVSQFRTLSGFDRLVSLLVDFVARLSSNTIPSISETSTEASLPLSRKVVFLLRNMVVDEACERESRANIVNPSSPVALSTPSGLITPPAQLLIELPPPLPQNSTALNAPIANDSSAASTREYPSTTLLRLRILSILISIFTLSRDTDLLSKCTELVSEIVKVRPDVTRRDSEYGQEVAELRTVLEQFQETDAEYLEIREHVGSIVELLKT